MRQRAPILLTLACSLTLAGCGAESPGPASSSAPPPTASSASSSASTPAAEIADLELVLDNGSKWPVDEHTRSSAAQMTVLVEGTAPFDSVDDARALGAAIDENLRSLIDGCTMTGPAHDQLHVVLVALFPRVDTLKAGTDLSRLRTTQQEIGLILDEYERHFD